MLRNPGGLGNHQYNDFRRIQREMNGTRLANDRLAHLILVEITRQQRLFKPGAQFIKNRACLLLASSRAIFRSQFPGLFLNPVQLLDQCQTPTGNTHSCQA